MVGERLEGEESPGPVHEVVLDPVPNLRATHGAAVPQGGNDCIRGCFNGVRLGCCEVVDDGSDPIEIALGGAHGKPFLHIDHGRRRFAF